MFTSKSQMRFMYATHPKIAKEMTKRQEKKMGKKVFKNLPNKKKKRSRDDFCLFESWFPLSDGVDNE